MGYLDYDLEQVYSCLKDYLLYLFVLICFMYYTKLTSTIMTPTPTSEEASQWRPPYLRRAFEAYYSSEQTECLGKADIQDQCPIAVANTGISHVGKLPILEEFRDSVEDISTNKAKMYQDNLFETRSRIPSNSNNEREKEAHFDDECFDEVLESDHDEGLDSESVTISHQEMAHEQNEKDRDKRVPKMYRNSDCRRWKLS